MTTAREVMLARIRSALGPDPSVPEVPRAYRRAHDAGASRVALVDLFVDRLVDYDATVLRVHGPAAIADAVARGVGRATSVVVPPGLPDAWLPPAPAIVRDSGLTTAQLADIDAVVTGATVAIADTGTIVLDGSPDQGRRAITLVPDRHVCVLRTDQVVASVPAAVAQVDPTRPQTWISGPSATSDIELSRVEGVHGPRTLVVVLVDNSPADASQTRSF